MKFFSLAVSLVCIPLSLAVSQKLKTGTITVDDYGTELAYTDSGAPHNSHYTTVFAVHGQAFNGGIFSRVQLAARSSAVRIVSVTRRDYPGSTPFSADELLVLNGNGTESDRDQFQASRGLELVSFIDKFVQKEGISLSPKGGIAICGWSLGNSVTGSAIANFKSAPPSTIARLSPYIRTLVIHEPSPNIIGLDNDPRNYSPLTAVDPTIPEDSELPMFTEFVAGYFQHGNLSTRDPDVLEFYDHSFNLPPPSVYNMTASGHGDILVFSEPAKRDVTLQLNFVPQLLASYKALYTKELYETLPNLKNFFFGAEHTAGYGPLATWLVEEDDEAHGGGFIKAKLVSGINHMCAWDAPQTTLEIYESAITRTF